MSSICYLVITRIEDKVSEQASKPGETTVLYNLFDGAREVGSRSPLLPIVLYGPVFVFDTRICITLFAICLDLLQGACSRFRSI